MKRYYSKIILIAVLILSLLLGGCTDQTTAFREDVAGRVGDHVYYSYNLYEGRKLDEAAKKELFDYLDVVDQKLTEDVYVTGWCYSSFDGRILIYGQLRVNGANVPSVTYMTDFEDPTPNISSGSEKYADGIQIAEGICFQDVVNSLKKMNTSSAIDPGELIPAVTERAQQHKDELRDYDKKGVYGEYLLCYDIDEQRLIYDFRVNEDSEIVFDAMTGELVKERYWDGTIID
ncbi:MAG: hypothetical protein IKS85_00150 [Lachnospiraceae bacterium]|nr:hypothetical protein [Lachnospiraceae bacterium]